VHLYVGKLWCLGEKPLSHFFNSICRQGLCLVQALEEADLFLRRHAYCRLMSG
jgi:hypothetical protein